VDRVVTSIEAGGKRAVLLVGRRADLGAIALRDAIGPRAISVLAFVDGKACVRGPGEKAAKCVHSPDNRYVEKAFVRQLVREAREAFEVDDVRVEVPRSLPWGDVVNAIDGARTCCGQASMRVAVATAADDAPPLVPIE
jgi:hypothetical protein